MSKNNKFLIFLLILNIFEPIHLEFVSININDLNEDISCFTYERESIDDKFDITYELTNSKLNRTLFIQYKSIESIKIYKANQDESSIIHKNTKEGNEFGYYHFMIELNIDKYLINIKGDKNVKDKYKMCLNLFQQGGNIFKKSTEKPSIKISSYDIITSGRFPFSLNDTLSFHALRYNLKYEQYFSINSFICKAYPLNSDNILTLNINELYKKGNYKYLIFNFEHEKNYTIREIIIDAEIELKNEDSSNKFEIELVDSEGIYYAKRIEIENDKSKIQNKVYFVNLQQQIFANDLDILLLTNNIVNELILSTSDGVNNNNIKTLKNKFMLINKNLLDKPKYKIDIKPVGLLLYIIDEEFVYDGGEKTFYDFKFLGNAHLKYNYNEDITKEEFFSNSNKIVINSDNCDYSFSINYFTDKDKDKIIDFETIIGNTSLYQTSNINLANSIEDYLSNINLYSINDIKNSILTGNFSFIKFFCNKNEKVLSYIFAYDKINDYISLKNQRTLILIEKNKEYTFKFDESLKSEKFKMKLRILKKDQGQVKIKINYNGQDIIEQLNEKNSIELTHNENAEYLLKISLSNEEGISKSLIIEIIKEIDVEEKLIQIVKNSVELTKLESSKYLYLYYEQNESNKGNINIKNIGTIDAKICMHQGYGYYPYLIKPTCNSENEYINLKPNEELSFSLNNPYISTSNSELTDDFYISLISNTEINYKFEYQKNSNFNSSEGYKNINFKGKEIIDLERNNKLPMVYYEIISCKELNYEPSNNKGIFYYFHKSNQMHYIKSNIYSEYDIEYNIPRIIFIKNDTYSAKFKYIYGVRDKLKIKDNFNNKINANIDKQGLKLTIKPSFNGEIILNIIINFSSQKKQNYCDAVDKYEELKKSKEKFNLYGLKFYQETINIADNNDIKYEISSDKITEFDGKEVDIFIISTLKEIDYDIFYEPIKIKINFDKEDTEEVEEDDDESSANTIITVIFFVLIFIFIILIMIFIYRRNKKIKTSKDINYGVNEESNKLF